MIVTSWVFREGRIDRERLKRLERAAGKERLVLDLSCRKKGAEYYIVTDRWQKFTDVALTPQVLDELASHCAEFLIHAVDVEGRSQGIEKVCWENGMGFRSLTRAAWEVMKIWNF